jgi:tetratricopeptide (TPR) repeat protein
VARTEANLGGMYLVQAKYVEAEAIYEDALRIFLIVHGPNNHDHPDVVMVQNDLGNVYNKLGRHNKAEHMHRNALRAKRAVFGRDHSDVATR